MTPEQTAAHYRDSPRARRIALLTISLGYFLNPIVLSSINVAIPAITADLQASAVLVSWLPTAFMLASVALLLPVANLADLYGRKRFYLIGMTLLSAAHILAALSPNMIWLLACRLLQGTAAAFIFGTGMAMITTIFPPDKRGGALGMATGTVYVGLTLGPFIGGLVTDAFGWRALFLAQLPFSLLVIFLTLKNLKGEWFAETEERFDWLGSLLFASLAILLVVGLSKLPSIEGISSIFAGIGLLFVFVHHQGRVEKPLINIGALRANRVFSFSLIASVMMYASMFPLSFMLSLYLQYIGGLSPSVTGQVMIVQALVMAITAPFSGRLSDRYEARHIATAGCLTVTLGFVCLSFLGLESSVWLIIVGQLFVGLGFGFFSTPNTNAAMGSLRLGRVGIASAVINLSRSMGNLLGMGIVTLLFSLHIGSEVIRPELYGELLTALRTALIIAGCFTLVGAFYSYNRGNVHVR